VAKNDTDFIADYSPNPMVKEFEQVAQLWQSDQATLALLSINVQLYPQNHKIAFLSHPMGASWAI